MKSIGYYPGCSLSGTAAEYDRSLRAVAAHIGLQLVEIPDWVCCGASSAHAIDHHAAICLAADTLAKAKKAGLDEVLTPCAMCYQRLACASHEMYQQPGLEKRLAEALGEAPGLRLGDVRPVSMLRWLTDVLEADATQMITQPLKGLKVACYYGCLLLRPPKVTGETSVEAPRSMERLLTLMGAEPVRWSMAMECCGGSFALSRKEVVLRQGRRVYDAAKDAGADMISLACPMCHSNIDMRQEEFGVFSDARLPVVYLTQLLGLAMNLPPESLGFAGHFVPVEPALEKLAASGAAVSPG